MADPCERQVSDRSCWRRLSRVSTQKPVSAFPPGHSRADGQCACHLRDASHDGHRKAEGCLTCALHWTPGRRSALESDNGTKTLTTRHHFLGLLSTTQHQCDYYLRLRPHA